MTLVYDYIAGVKTAAVKSYIAATGDTATDWRISVGDAGETAAIAYDAARGFSLALPNMPLEGVLTRKEVERLTGYWLHEVLGHAVQTDFAAWNEAVRLGLAQAVNCIEDVRIERGITRNPSYPNAKHYLETLVDSIAYKAAKSGFDWDKPGALLSAIAYIGRVELLGYNCPSLPALSSLSGPMQNTLRTIFAEIKNCRNGKVGTWDALDIARRLQNVGQALQQAMQSQGKAQANGAPGQASQAGDAEGQGDAGEQSASQGDDAQQGGSGNTPDQGQDDAGQKKGGTGSGAGKAVFDDMLDTTPKDITQRFGLSDKPARHHDARMKQASNAIVSKWQGERIGPMPAHNAMTSMRVQAKGNTFAQLKSKLAGAAKLRTDIKNFVTSPDRVSFERYLESGRIDTRLAAKIRAGSTRVFKRRHEDEGQNAAVMFLMDISPSMNNGMDVAATVLAIHMAEAIEHAGAPVCVAAFDDSTAKAQAHLRIAKPFNKRLRACASSMELLAEYKSNGTNMSPAIIAAAKFLKTAPATRHILFVLTDGECAHTHQACYKSAQVAENLGVEVIGFGVGCDVSEAFPTAIRVPTDMQEIARTGLRALAKKLKDKRAA